MKGELIRRSFEAATHPKGSAERAKLNEDWRTSEYMRSQKYALLYPTPAGHYCTFRTRRAAEEANV